MGAASATRRTPPPTRWRRTSVSALGNPFRRTSRSAAGGGTEAGDAGPSMHSGRRSGQRLRQRRCRWTRAPLPPWGGSTCLRFSSGVSRRSIRAALRAPVTRRAASYEFRSRLVSIRTGDTVPGCRRVQLLVQHLHARNCDKPSQGSQSLWTVPNVPRRFRTSQNVSRPSDAVASGTTQRPRRPSKRRPSKGVTRLAGPRCTQAVPGVSLFLTEPGVTLECKKTHRTCRS